MSGFYLGAPLFIVLVLLAISFLAAAAVGQHGLRCPRYSLMGTRRKKTALVSDGLVRRHFRWMRDTRSRKRFSKQWCFRSRLLGCSGHVVFFLATLFGAAGHARNFAARAADRALRGAASAFRPLLRAPCGPGICRDTESAISSTCSKVPRMSCAPNSVARKKTT